MSVPGARGDYEELAEQLIEAGLPEAEVAAATAGGYLDGLAMELALRPPGPMVGFAEAAAMAGLAPDFAKRLWMAMGFPDPDNVPTRIDAQTAEALGLLAEVSSQLIGVPTTLALARLLGTATSRLAEAVVDAFRVNFEAPALSAGTSYSEVMEQYAQIAGKLLPRFINAIDAALRRHMVAVVSSQWSLEDDASAARRDLTVGFVDLVGYTEISRSLTGGQLASAVGRFDELVDEVVTNHGGRVVKLLGDGAFFVFEESEPARRASDELVSRFEAEPALPSVRVGLASGSVVSLHGDYYGDVVNRAARLAKTADPGSVKTSD